MSVFSGLTSPLRRGFFLKLPQALAANLLDQVAQVGDRGCQCVDIFGGDCVTSRVARLDISALQSLEAGSEITLKSLFAGHP